MLEKFEVYLYDGIFYTLEQLENLGFVPNEPGTLRIRYKKVICYADGEETIYDTEWDFLEAYQNESKAIFIKPILETDPYTLVIVAAPYFGLRYQERSTIMKSAEKRDKIFSEMEEFIEEKIASIPNSKDQRNYHRQEEEKQKIRRLQNLIPKIFEQNND